MLSKSLYYLSYITLVGFDFPNTLCVFWLKFQDTEDEVLSSIYSVGQLVSCIVLKLDNDDKKEKEKGKHKIWLSLRLSLLHSNFTLDILQEGMVSHFSDCLIPS